MAGSTLNSSSPHVTPVVSERQPPAQSNHRQSESAGTLMPFDHTGKPQLHWRVQCSEYCREEATEKNHGGSGNADAMDDGGNWTMDWRWHQLPMQPPAYCSCLRSFLFFEIYSVRCYLDKPNVALSESEHSNILPHRCRPRARHPCVLILTHARARKQSSNSRRTSATFSVLDRYRESFGFVHVRASRPRNLCSQTSGDLKQKFRKWKII